MDQSRTEGVSKKVSGSLKEAIGKVTGDTEAQAEGVAEKTAGRLESAAAGGKNAARDASND